MTPRHRLGYKAKFHWSAGRNNLSSLNEKEFAFYFNKFSGGRIEEIEDIYKPPSFYMALGASLFKFTISVGAGLAATAAIPEVTGAARLSAPSLATTTGRAAVSSAAGAVADRLTPGGLTPESDRERRLWPLYLVNAHRRRLR